MLLQKLLFTATVWKYIYQSGVDVVQDQDREEEKVVNVSQIYGNYDNIVNVQSVKQNSIYWETFLRGSGWKSHAILFVLDNIFHSLDNSVGVEASRVQVYCKFIPLAVFAMFGPVLQSTAGQWPVRPYVRSLHREWRNDPPLAASQAVRPGKYRTLLCKYHNAF